MGSHLEMLTVSHWSYAALVVPYLARYTVVVHGFSIGCSTQWYTANRTATEVYSMHLANTFAMHGMRLPQAIHAESGQARL